MHVFVCAGANWIGEYNIITRSYDSINMTNIGNSLLVVKNLVQLHKDDPVVVGMTPGTYVRKNICMYMYTCMQFQDFYGCISHTQLFCNLTYEICMISSYQSSNSLSHYLTALMHYLFLYFLFLFLYSYTLTFLYIYSYIFIFSYYYILLILFFFVFSQ